MAKQLAKASQIRLHSRNVQQLTTWLGSWLDKHLNLVADKPLTAILGHTHLAGDTTIQVETSNAKKNQSVRVFNAGGNARVIMWTPKSQTKPYSGQESSLYCQSLLVLKPVFDQANRFQHLERVTIPDFTATEEPYETSTA